MLYPLSYERRLNPRQCTALGTLPAGASFRAGWHAAALSWAGRLAGHRGHSTREIVAKPHISANTVQEHVTAAFDKFGVRGRRELVVAVTSGRHWPTS